MLQMYCKGFVWMMMGNNCHRVAYRYYLVFGSSLSIRHRLETESIPKPSIRRINGIVYYTVLLLKFNSVNVTGT